MFNADVKLNTRVTLWNYDHESWSQEKNNDRMIGMGDSV